MGIVFTMSVVFPCTSLLTIPIIKILWEKTTIKDIGPRNKLFKSHAKTLNSNSNPPIATNVSTSHRVYSKSAKANTEIFDDIVHQSAQTFNRNDLAFA